MINNNDLIINNETNGDNFYKNGKYKYNDHEINCLSYKEAIKIDKRTYIDYYMSLLKRKQIIIFTFYLTSDYNSRSIKISLFLFLFSLYYAVNSLFFDDNTMHRIYKDEGKYNFIYHIRNIIYSTLISNIIGIVIKYLSLSESDIIEIKKNNDEHKNKTILKCIKIKFVLFFILNFLFLLFFWYYISCFCAVYKNTQVHLIKDTLLTFGLSLLYPVGLYLLPSIFRIPSLREKKNDKECLYQLSIIIQNLI